MIEVYVPDVGDGLAAGIWTLTGTPVQIDCGSQQRASLAHHKGLEVIDPDVFFLSHFHLDHYNGLLAAQPNTTTIKDVYYPRLPDFENRQDYLQRALAMQHWLMGDTSGSMAADLLGAIARSNRNEFTYRSLAGQRNRFIRVGG